MRGTSSRCQCGAVVQPRVQRHERLAAHALQAPHELGEQAERRAEQVAAQALGLGAGGRDQHLVGNAARDRATGDETAALEHGHDLRQAALRDHGRRRRRQPGELRVRMRQRGSRVAALVQEREAVAADVARAPLPRFGDELEGGVGQLADRMHVRRARGSRPPAARAPGRGSARRGRPSPSARHRAAGSRAASGPRARRRTGTPQASRRPRPTPRAAPRARARPRPSARSSGRASRPPC